VADECVVSIILPTLNRADLLPRSIRSVLEQTFTGFELIVVDDGSTDHTAEVVASFSDGRIKYHRHEMSRGAAAARNTGWRMSRGRYIAFQDSDDQWSSSKLAAQLRAIENASSRVGTCVCSLRQHIDGEVLEVIHPAGERMGRQVIKQLAGGISYGTVALLVKREVFEATDGFDERLPRRQDYDLCLKLAEQGSFVFLPDILIETFRFADSISMDPFKFVDATQMIFAKHSHIFGRYTKGYSLQLYRAGKYLLRAGHYRPALSLLMTAIRANPLNWRAHVLTAGLLSGVIPIIKKLRS
jgi:glycosyltransferase involved in cell wall biosynthesis